jgi:hypothetical protein
VLFGLEGLQATGVEAYPGWSAYLYRPSCAENARTCRV